MFQTNELDSNVLDQMEKVFLKLSKKIENLEMS